MDCCLPHNWPLERKSQGRSKKGERKKQGRSKKKSEKDENENQEKSKKESKRGRELQVSTDWEGTSKWRIAHLKPGETKTIRVRAVGHKTGKIKTCLSVSYNPALCLTRQFVKADLELTKTAPSKADVCKVLTFKYKIKNSGNGVANGVVIHDDLPEGLTTKDGGKKELKFKVGKLGPNESKEFTAKVIAQKGGEYTSQAVGTTNNDVRVRSQKTTTKLTQPKLEVKLAGQEEGMVGQPLAYKVTVTNTGDAPAKNTKLMVETPEETRPIRATPKNKKSEELTWNFGNLKPGAEKSIRVVLVAKSMESVKIVAKAESKCERDIDSLSGQAKIETKLTKVPALQFSAADKQDPLAVGQKGVFKVSVRNEGSAPDHNVQIVAKLPNNFKFLKLEGRTKEAKSEDREITFAKVKKLEPGQRAEWTLHVEAVKAGNAQTRFELTSRYLNSPLPNGVPTIVAPSGTNVGKSKNQKSK